MVCCVTLGAAFVMACGDDEAAPGAGHPQVAPAADAAQAELQAIAGEPMSFDELMARFDVNGDERIDADDVRDAQRCIEANDVGLDGLLCDVVPDGKPDLQDLYALRIVSGEARLKQPQELLELAERVRELADGQLSGLSSASYDYDADGSASWADLRRLAELLAADPNHALDVNGDQVLDLGDVSELARRQARIAAGQTADALDVNGDGTSDIQDVYLLAELSLFTAARSFGVYDHDLNGRVDRDDFCASSASASASLKSSFFALLMPPAEASAAQGRQTRLSICRSDGQAELRAFSRIDTGQQIRLEPEGLYLTEVVAPPAGYAPVAAERLAGRRLFVVGSAPSERPLRAVVLPWGSNSAETSSLVIGGPALPAEASLLLPASSIELGFAAADSGGASGARIWSREAGASYEAPVFDVSFDDAAKASATDFFERMSDAKTKYAALIAGCPCELDAATRQELVRWLVRAKHCLDSDLGVARAQLAAARLEQARLARLSVSASNEAAARWNLLADDIWTMEIVSSLLLVAETGYDFLSGGLGKAFAGAAANGAGELDKDLRSDDGLFGESAKSLVTGLPAGALEAALTETLRGISKNPAAPTGLREFTRQVVDGVVKELNKPINGKALAKGTLESVIKLVIKAVPTVFVKFSQIRAMESETRATDLLGRLWEVNLQVGQLQNVVGELERGTAELQSLRGAFLAKLSADGCGTSITTADPCSFDLEAALAAAQATLDTDLATADAQLAAALEETPSGDGECTTGTSRKQLDREAVALSGVGRQLWETARGEDPAAALEQLDQSAGEAAERYEGVAGDFRKLCDLFAQPQISQAQVEAINAAQDARVAANARFEAAAKSALEAYEQCLLSAGEPGGSCGFDADLAFDAPWAAAARCVGCLPDVTMDCGSAVPPTFTAIGTDLGISNADLQLGFRPLSISTIVHSSTNVPSQATAGDHTTLRGYFAGTVSLDQARLDALWTGTFACGPTAQGFTLCAPGAPPSPGEFLVLMAGFAAPMPLNDPGQIYQYGFVFDSDGAAAGNYAPSAPYTNDFFGGTDRWFEADRNASGTWSIKATDASISGFPAASTQARILVQDDTFALLAPKSEFVATRPAFRLTAFRHTGDYGLNPPYDWDGSVYPSVAGGLEPFP